MPLLHCAPLGSGFPNLLEARRSLLIRQAHRILNSPGMVHDLDMSRLRGLCKAWGYPTYPLNMLFHTNVGYHQHWFARVHSALRAYNSTMPDVLRQVVLKPVPRLKNRPLAPLLPHNIFVRLHSVLAERHLLWLGDVIDVIGTKLSHRNTLHLNTVDWQLLAEALAPDHQLLHTTDALLHGQHMVPFEACPHKIGDPKNGAPLQDSHHSSRQSFRPCRSPSSPISHVCKNHPSTTSAHTESFSLP